MVKTGIERLLGENGGRSYAATMRRVKDLPNGTCVFTLPVASDASRALMSVEFRPACTLDESQRRLLQAGAHLMTALYTTSELADRA
jgi:hypothetical protein